MYFDDYRTVLRYFLYIKSIFLLEIIEKRIYLFGRYEINFSANILYLKGLTATFKASKSVNVEALEDIPL